MAFSISSISRPPEKIFGELCQWCEIKIADFSERFAAPIEQWTLDDYMNQWRGAVIYLVDGGSKTYFVAAMRDPCNSECVSVYALYREGERVFVQNQIVLCAGNESEIFSGDLSRLIEERESETEDGEKISEWETSLEDLKKFFARGS